MNARMYRFDDGPDGTIRVTYPDGHEETFQSFADWFTVECENRRIARRGI
ncbi:MAG: hypothetical protein WC551_08970 [Patescibacteria group bacterium]